MKIISHRGNIKGRVPKKENRPSYVDCALQLGLDVEVDIWAIADNKLWLGHDGPDYQVDPTWIYTRKNNVWFHCKNLQAAYILNKIDPEIIKFCHRSDSYTLVSNGTLWVHDLSYILNDKCIIPLLSEEDLFNNQSIISKYEIYGVCTDYPYNEYL